MNALDSLYYLNVSTDPPVYLQHDGHKTTYIILIYIIYDMFITVGPPNYLNHGF